MRTTTKMTDIPSLSETGPPLEQSGGGSTIRGKALRPSADQQAKDAVKAPAQSHEERSKSRSGKKAVKKTAGIIKGSNENTFQLLSEPSEQKSAQAETPPSEEEEKHLQEKTSPAENSATSVRETPITGSDRVALERSARPKSWAELCDWTPEEGFAERVGATYLERQVVAEAAVKGFIRLPMNLRSDCPRICDYLELACKFLEIEPTFSESGVGSVLHGGAWVRDNQASQTYLASLNNDARKAERRKLISVVDFFQGLVMTTQLPIKEPTRGLYWNASLFVESYEEAENKRPRLETRRQLMTGSVRNGLLEDIKSVFPSPGAAANLLNLGEIISQKVFEKTLGRKVPTEYVSALTQAIKPKLTIIAHNAYRKGTVVAKAPPNKRGQPKKEDERKTVVRPPAINTSEKEVGQIATSEEKMILRGVQQVLLEARTQESLETACEDESLFTRKKKVEDLVGRCYALTDAVNAEMYQRVRSVKTLCVAEAKHLVEQKKVESIKAAFDAAMWSRFATEASDDFTSIGSVVGPLLGHYVSAKDAVKATRAYIYDVPIDDEDEDSERRSVLPPRDYEEF